MPRDPKKVLIVDDEPLLLQALELGLPGQEKDFAILTADSGRKALAVMEDHEIDVVVADLVMPEISGLELMEIVRDRQPGADFILMTGFGSEKIRNTAREGGCSFFIEKPFLISDLKRCLRELLKKKGEGFAGVLKNIPLPDLIQMCCVAGTSMSIRVRNGQESGTIHIRKGEIVHAESGPWMGSDAFYRILGWASGRFETLEPTSLPGKTLDKNWQFLLMEAARMADEAGKELPAGEGGTGPARVLVVDDSAVMRKILSEAMEKDGLARVAALANNGEEALRMISEARPDVITLDVNMPVMDGGTALKHIMIKSPCPVVIISSVGSGGGEKAQENILDFLRLGAVDFITKPRKGEDFLWGGKSLGQRLSQASRALTRNFSRVKNPAPVPEGEKARGSSPCRRLVVILSGAGGHGELIRLVSLLPAGTGACILALQDMPRDFTPRFAGYLDARSRVPVRPLSDSSPVAAPACYLATPDLAVAVEPGEGGTPVFRLVPGDEGAGVPGLLLSACGDGGLAPLVLLLSGAPLGDAGGLMEAMRSGARFISQKPECSMVPQPLEAAMEAGLVEALADPEGMRARIVEFGGPDKAAG